MLNLSLTSQKLTQGRALAGMALAVSGATGENEETSEAGNEDVSSPSATAEPAVQPDQVEPKIIADLVYKLMCEDFSVYLERGVRRRI